MSAAVVMHPIARRFVRDPMVAKPRACRNLFGRPNQEEIDQLLTTELQNAKVEDTNKYNFDFDSDSPLQGKYEWDSCDPQDIPAFYRPVTVNSNGKRLPQRTPCLASEATTRPVSSVQSATQHTQNTDSSALPLGLQARLHGLSDVSSHQQSSQQSSSSTTKTDTTSNQNVSTSSTCATEPMKLKRPAAVKCPNRRKTAGSAASNQPKITEFMQIRKRKTEDDDVLAKRRRDNSQLTATSSEENTL